ncbi:MAG: molybdenum cofactor biosynthesis protein MoaB [Deltaproteobacteria bacterium]|nr:molybdenum cofactor biosynthesis protein MoaB [Deltaproteobacteria bacterium]
MSSKIHKKDAPKNVTIGILTVSSTRTLTNDKSGQWIRKLARKEGHQVVYHQVIPDDIETISDTVLEVIRDLSPHALLLTGGTGISPKDLTIEAVNPLFEKELAAFGPLYAQLSYEKIDSAALLSRATAGVIGKTMVFCMPGSLNACKLACKALIFPELGHLVKHVNET